VKRVELRMTVEKAVSIGCLGGFTLYTTEACILATHIPPVVEDRFSIYNQTEYRNDRIEMFSYLVRTPQTGSHSGLASCPYGTPRGNQTEARPIYLVYY